MPSSPYTIDSLKSIQKLQRYVHLLKAHGQKTNLISPENLKNEAILWQRHIQDSALLIPFLKPFHTFVDIGSGAGLPGIVLAALTGKKGILIDARRKRTEFLQAVAEALDLPIDIYCTRMETFSQKMIPADACFVSRAFKPLKESLFILWPHLGSSRTYLCLKGTDYKQQIQQAQTLYDFDLDVSQPLAHANSWVLLLTNIRKKP